MKTTVKDVNPAGGPGAGLDNSWGIGQERCPVCQVWKSTGGIQGGAPPVM